MKIIGVWEIKCGCWVAVRFTHWAITNNLTMVRLTDERLTHAGDCSKCFTYIHSFSLDNNTLRLMLLFAPFDRGRS